MDLSAEELSMLLIDVLLLLLDFINLELDFLVINLVVGVQADDM